MSETATQGLEKRLLVVDDEEGPRESLKMIFGDEYNVTVAASGEEAIEFVRKKTFQVIVTDIRMRGLSGIDVLREVRKIDSHVEVIVLTAYETLETARQAISLGASEYLKKPFDLDHIQKVVGSCYRDYIYNTQHDMLIRQSVNAAKQDFIGIVSHELNTPMNGILGFLNLLENTKLDEDQVECVQTIRDCSLKYFEQVQDILTYAKISINESEMSHATFNPATLALKLIQEFEVPDSIELETDIPDDLPETVSGAEQEIRILLRKLLLNAFKFTPKGRIFFSVRARATSRGLSLFEFTVRDTGPGIDEKLLADDRVFDALAQGDSTPTRLHGGLGLGLSLCKSIADRLGGCIEVRSEKGSGTTFIFSCDLEVDRS
jgi:signal transduction histidine kinase